VRPAPEPDVELVPGAAPGLADGIGSSVVGASGSGIFDGTVVEPAPGE
jgi:hypothetical protein